MLANLPPAPARVLEVGCGEGELARALAAAGYDVVAIDPVAPAGEIFRPIKLEDLEEDERFDAVVASRSFHHTANLSDNLERVARATPGPFVLDEFAWDQLDEPTAEWYEGQRRVLVAAGKHPSGPSAAEWESHHAGVHGLDTLLNAVRERFEERTFERVPYLWRYLGGPATAELEETLVMSGLIRPLGFRLVGMPRRDPSLEN